MVLAHMCALGFELLTGIGVTIIGSFLVAWVHMYCYAHLELWLLCIGLVISISALAGLFFLSNNYPRCYTILIVVNILVLLSFLVVLAMFWTVVGASHNQAEHLWRRKFIPDKTQWKNVVQCFQSLDFCSRTSDLRECCEAPTGCEVTNSSMSLDCLNWREENHSTCYLCESCKRAVFFHFRSYGKHVDPVLISSFIVLALVVVIQVCIEYQIGGGQFVGFFHQLYHQWIGTREQPHGVEASEEQHEEVPQ